MESHQQKFSVGYVLMAVLGLLLIQSLLFAPHVDNVTYSEFKTLVKKGKVSDLVLDRQSIAGTLAVDGLEGVLAKERIAELKRNGGATHRFVTARVDDPGLVADLEAANVKFAGRIEVTWLTTLLSWVLPALVFVSVWMFVTRRMGGAQGGLLSMGKSRAKVYMQHSTGVTFDDVAGIDEARRRSSTSSRRRSATSGSAARSRKVCSSSGRRARARHSSQRPSRARPECPSSVSAARTSWRCSSGWAPRGSATSSPRPRRRRRASSSSTSSTRSARPVG
jgi:FtsH-like protein